MIRVHPTRDPSSSELALVVDHAHLNGGRVPGPEELERLRGHVASGMGGLCPMLVARSGGGDPVGFALPYTGYSSFSAATTLFMGNLFVAEPWRGTGVADLLMGAVVDVARQEGHCRLMLDVRDANERAIRFYARHGAKRQEGRSMYSVAIP